MFTKAWIDSFQLHPTVDNKTGVLTLDGLGTPAPRIDTVPFARRQGVADRTRFFNGRTIALRGRVMADTNDDVMTTFDALKGAFALDADGAARVFKIRRDGIDYDEVLDVRLATAMEAQISPTKPFLLFYTVQLLANDPRWFSETVFSANYNPATALSAVGLTFPLDFPLVFGSSGGGGSGNLDITHNGNFPTPPIFTITGPVTTPQLQNLTTSKSFFISGSLLSTDTLVIDVKARTVELNGTLRNDLVIPANTDWWDLIPGLNETRMVGSGMDELTTDFQVQWQDARI